ncbi:hypothetical protein HDU97_007370 [Phlyctochytrium planicorne]|nr:hypothetical protein HDU97_007370 [Phlyctochytrium planicorne]
MQILLGIAWLNYAFFRKDIFIYLQFLPGLVTGVAFTLQWHPYLRKRVRRAHETVMTIGLTLILLGTVGTSVSPYIDAEVSRYSLGAFAGATTLAYAGSLVRDDFRLAFPVDGNFDRPGTTAFIVNGLGVLFGGAWGAYGFYGAQDPFVYVSNLVIAAACILSLLLLAYTAYRSGGLETGWDSQSEDDDFDAHVQSLNRANTRSSYAGSNRSLPRSLSRRVPQNPYDVEYGVEQSANGSSSGATLMTEVKYPSDEEIKNNP